MTSPDMMKYGLGAMADAVHSTAQYSQQLEQICQEATNLLAGSQEFFTTNYGSDAYNHAQQLIVQAIDNGKDVINNHGQVVDASASNWDGHDAAVGHSF